MLYDFNNNVRYFHKITMRAFIISLLFVSARAACTPSSKPPRGTNTWDSYAGVVTEADVLATAAWMKQNLFQYGFDTVVVDGGWYTDLQNGGNIIDDFGRPMPDVARFPSAADGRGLKSLAEKVNAMGLRFGAWSIRGIPIEAVERDLPIAGSQFTARQAVRLDKNCTWDAHTIGTNASTPAAAAWYAAYADMALEWGLSFIKLDCMYQNGLGWYDEVGLVASTFAARAPAITISWSPGGGFTPAAAAFIAERAPAWGVQYRVFNDFHDEWKSLLEHLENSSAFAPFIGANGSYPDQDMLPFGRQAPNARPNLFTADEQRTVMTLWSVTRSPLFLGAVVPLAPDDNITLPLVSNARVLAVNEASCDNAPAPILNANTSLLFAWGAELPSGGRVAALFNAREVPTEVTVAAEAGACVLDMWSGMQEGTIPASGVLSRTIPPHGAGMWEVGVCESRA